MTASGPGVPAPREPRNWPQYERAQRATAHYAEMLARGLSAPQVPGRESPARVAAGRSCLACCRLESCMLWLASGAPAGAVPDCPLAALATRPCVVPVLRPARSLAPCT